MIIISRSKIKIKNKYSNNLNFDISYFIHLIEVFYLNEHFNEQFDPAYTQYTLLRYFCGFFFAVLFSINLVYHVFS